MKPVSERRKLRGKCNVIPFMKSMPILVTNVKLDLYELKFGSRLFRMYLASPTCSGCSISDDISAAAKSVIHLFGFKIVSSVSRNS